MVFIPRRPCPPYRANISRHRHVLERLARKLFPTKVSGEPKSDHGFALLLVIVAIGLLAYASAIFATSTRALVRTVSAQVESARAEAVAEVGINLAVLNIVQRRSGANRANRDWAGRQGGCRIGEDHLFIQVQDEGGKIDLNFASERLLRALLAGLQVAPDRVASLVDAIVDFRDRDDAKRPNGAEAAEYFAAGRERGPKNAPFAIVEELHWVLGLDQELVGRMLPFVTAHSGKDGIDPDAAPRDLVGLIKNGDRTFYRSGDGEDIDFEPEFTGVPDHFIARSSRSVFTVRSEALMANGVRFVREAIVDLSPTRESRPEQPAPVYRLWRWRRAGSNSDSTRPEASPVAVPPC
jgi:general secretion pathway protein K